MKRSLVVMLVLVALTAMALANGPSVKAEAFDKATVERNLLAGLASGNAGLQRSCALMLGQIKSERAVFALMSKLRTSPEEGVRIASAWALSRIGDPVGTYFVKTTVSFDESSKLRAYCAWYYNVNVKAGTFTIYEAPEAVPTVALNFIPVPVAD
jgi:HEAT repeat protein